MIITCKKEVPLRWIAFAILPWASFSFNSYVVGVAFLFSLKKFVENPVGLTFILSLPGFISLLLQPTVSFLSDRIWTRYGRRKPFVATSLTGVAFCLLLLPLMPNFWTLLAVFMILNVFTDLSSPMEPLQQEIIPPHERGRATGAMTWCSNLACMVFYFIALGRFDDVRFMGGFPISGETAIYWSGAVLTSAMALLIMLGVREINPHSALRGQRFSIRNFFGGLLDRELWPVYMLVVGSACLNFYAGLGPLSNLLYTDQWGYTKQEMGINIAVGGIINMFAIGLLTFFADRLNRMRAYQILICLSLMGNVLYYCYINFVLPDKRPSLIEIIVFGESLSILAILTNLIYIPLVYDYVTRNKMGTYNAGAQMVMRLTILITLNGVGLFVWAYSSFFQPPAGEMTRLILRGEHNEKSEVLNVIRSGVWTYPQSGSPTAATEIQANAWQATGTLANDGRCWEIRLRNKQSEKIAEQKEKLDNENSPLMAEEKMLRDKATTLKLKGQIEEARHEDRKADDKQVRIDEITTQIKAIDDQLTARANNFHEQAIKIFGDRLVAEGDQVIGAKLRQAVLLALSTTKRPDTHALEKTLNDLRHLRQDIIDLRPLKLSEGYGIAVSAILEPGADEAGLAHDLQVTVERIATKYAPGLFISDAVPIGLSHQPALTLDLMVVEEPLDTYVSPVTRVVNLVLAIFDQVPDPDKRLVAMSRNLRVPTETNHVRVEPGPGSKTISITAVLPTNAPKAALVNDPVNQRLQTLLGNNSTEDVLAQARAFYDRIEIAAASQRLTLVHPSLTSAYAPMKYDYTSGYLWMFLMGLIGIAITVAFVRLEARGLIRKRGIEEAQAS